MLGHLQRGGMPTGYDRLLATRFGGAAVRAIAEEKWGQMVALQSPHIVTIPIEEVLAGAEAGRPDARRGADGAGDGDQLRRLRVHGGGTASALVAGGRTLSVGMDSPAAAGRHCESSSAVLTVTLFGSWPSWIDCRDVAPRLPFSSVSRDVRVALENLMKLRIALLTLICSAGLAGVGARRRRARTTCPRSTVRPQGMCRIWLDKVPPKQQPAPTDCPTAVRNRPSNGKVIFGDDYKDGRRRRAKSKRARPFLRKFGEDRKKP